VDLVNIGGWRYGVLEERLGIGPSEGTNQLRRKHAGFLGEILRPGPVAVPACVPRLSKETADLFSQIRLRRVESLSVCLTQVAFGNGNIFASLSLVSGRVGRRELRRDLRHGPVRGRAVRFSAGLLYGRFAGCWRLFSRNGNRRGCRHHRRWKRWRGYARVFRRRSRIGIRRGCHRAHSFGGNRRDRRRRMDLLLRTSIQQGDQSTRQQGYGDLNVTACVAGHLCLLGCDWLVEIAHFFG